MNLYFDKDAEGKLWVVGFRKALERREEWRKEGRDITKIDTYIKDVTEELRRRSASFDEGLDLVRRSSSIPRDIYQVVSKIPREIFVRHKRLALQYRHPRGDAHSD